MTSLILHFETDWMTQTATKQKSARNKQQIYRPQHELSALLKFCGNKKGYEDFVKWFLIRTYSKKWNNAMMSNSSTRLSDIMTVSDEAFVCLVLKNNWDRWLDINNESNNKFAPSRRGSNNGITTPVIPKCTTINGHPSKEGAYGVRGWSDTGIERFNELCKLVKKDRKLNAKREDVIFQTVRSEMMKTRRSKKRHKPNTPRLKAYVDNDDSVSSSDEDEDDEDDSDDE